MDLQQVKERYAKMKDAELQHLAKYEIHQLRPEVVEYVKEEITKRGLDSRLTEVVDNQLRELSNEEIEQYIQTIQSLPCPKCTLQFERLNASLIHKIRSFIFMTNYESKIYIACDTCISKEKNKQLLLNSLLGWWGFPWGLIKTPVFITKHFTENAKRENFGKTILTEFVQDNASELYLRKDNTAELQYFIKRINEY